MAQKTEINFIEHFQNIKNCELIVLTTFVFDPIFFDGALLRMLRMNNQSAKIVVLIDAESYRNSQENFTQVTGIEYILIPIQYSLFHPKIFSFFSTKINNMFVGSHNLTLPGLTQNLELSFHTDKNEIAVDCLDYFYSLLSKYLDVNNPLLVEISKQKSSINVVGENFLLHNLEKPILEQALEKIRDEKISEVTIFAPYYSYVNELIKMINSTNPKKIKLCIQKGNHNLSLKGLKNFNNIEFNEIKVKPPNSSRRLHCKFILFNGKNNSFVLIGSPNFSKPALASIAENGNFEVAVILQAEPKFFDNLKFDLISTDEIAKSARAEFEPESHIEKKKITINMAYFDQFNRLSLDLVSDYSGKINLKFLPSNDEKQVEIKEGMQNYVFSDTPEGDYEVFFIENSLPASNRIRICSPKGLRTGLSFQKENSQSVINVVKDLNGLEDVLVFLSQYLSPEEKEGKPVKNPDGEHFPAPGQIRSGKSGYTLYDYILELLKIPHDKHAPSIPDDDKTSTTTENKQDVENPISKIIDKFIKFEKKNIKEQPTLKDYIIYLMISLKILKNLSLGHQRGISSAHIINGLNDMLVDKPINYEKESVIDYLSFLNVLIEASIEAEISLEEPYKFDDITVLQFTLLITKFLDSLNPLEEIISKLSDIPNYGIRNEFDDSRKNMVRTIFKQSLYHIPIQERKILAEKFLQIIVKDRNDTDVLSRFNVLKLFYENDPDLLKYVSQRSKELINSSKYRRFVSGILDEISHL